VKYFGYVDLSFVETAAVLVSVLVRWPHHRLGKLGCLVDDHIDVFHPELFVLLPFEQGLTDVQHLMKNEFDVPRIRPILRGAHVSSPFF
jgi:hypothetical protein